MNYQALAVLYIRNLLPCCGNQQCCMNSKCFSYGSYA
uniref:Uncharacterized protein n=1 Tax=Arundo donax TaxID=35708 RepID=A0A0A8XPS6_ARUDO